MRSGQIVALCLATLLHTAYANGQCGFPESYPDISLLETFQTENEFPEGYEVLYQCSPGFKQTNGTAKSICEDGKWTAVQMTCERIRCKPPENMTNGMFSISSGIFYGDKIYASCFKGYMLVGRSYRQCLANGVLDGINPQCIREDCDKPPTVENAVPRSQFLDQTVFASGSKLYYECVLGYVRAQGTYTITCTESSWSSPTLVCKRKECGSPPQLYNGDFEVTEGIEFGATIIAKCNEGYTLLGPNLKTCAANGQWEGGDPYCEVVKCEEPPEIKNGQITNPPIGSVTFGTVITYRCLRGSLIGNPSIVCNISGEYSPSPPKCTEGISCPNVIVDNSKKIQGFGPKYYYGNTITFECNHGYRINGSRTVTCGSENQWSPLPTCQRIICANVPNLENGRKKSEHSPPYSFKNTIYFTCEGGYRLIGSHFITCNENDEWSSELPTCKRIVCPDVKDLENGKKTPRHDSPYYFNDVISFACDAGYRMAGRQTITCNENEEWSSELPTCERIICPDVVVKNGNKISGHGAPYYINDNLNFICNIGYTMMGSNTITCQEDGHWSSEPPSCMVFSCGTPDILHNGKISVDRVNNAIEIAYAVCDKGYYLQRGGIQVCLASGWSEYSAECIRDDSYENRFLYGWIAGFICGLAI
ncbi:sushi, von Willebrand factor type A, EGF and pentraxin domain-containing protein 1-like, partial [Polypterus senegalus]|uniref:sushi, von Willebrand factor type A, EGF and pentraxin domain-containing protein 1-like n=1 Tax=Polypterus senegalus TaxID=55291 RepID=UPI0019642DB3